MPTVEVSPDEVTVRLHGIEVLGALRRKVRVPRSAVGDVRVVDEPYKLGLGIRAPGLSIPGRRRVGTFRARDGNAFVAAERGHRGVEIKLDGQPWARLVLSVDDPETLATKLRVDHSQNDSS